MSNVLIHDSDTEYKMFVLEKIIKRETTITNIENLLYEKIDINDPKMVLMSYYFGTKNYKC